MVQCLLFFPSSLPDTESDQQAWYYCYSCIHSYSPQCGGQLSVLGLGASIVASSLSGGSCSFSPFGPSRDGPAGIFSFYSMPALLHLGISTTSGGLGVECLQPSLDISGKLHVSSSCISSSGSVQVSGRTCQRSAQTFDSCGTMLAGGSLAPHSSQHVSRHSSAVPHHKQFHCGCLGRPGTQGSALSAFNPLAAEQCVLCRQGFSSSLSGSGGGNLSIYVKGLPAVLEGMGRLVCLTGCTKQCHLCP